MNYAYAYRSEGGWEFVAAGLMLLFAAGVSPDEDTKEAMKEIRDAGNPPQWFTSLLEAAIADPEVSKKWVLENQDKYAL